MQRNGTDTKELTDKLFVAITACKDIKEDELPAKLKEIEELIKAGADLAAKQEDQTPMRMAANINVEIVDIIIECKSSPEGDPYKYGDPLLDAVRDENTKRTKKLLNAGAIQSWRKSATGNRPMHLAVEKNNLSILRLLLVNDTDKTYILAANHAQKTACELAAELGHWNCVELFLESFKDVKQPEKTNPILEFVLQQAAKQNQCAIMQILLEQNISCNGWDSEKGNIALHWALQNKSSRMLALLLPHADKTRVDKNGFSIFEMAKQIGDADSIKVLAPYFPQEKNPTYEMPFILKAQGAINSVIRTVVASVFTNEDKTYTHVEPSYNNAMLFYPSQAMVTNPPMYTSYAEIPATYWVPTESSAYYPPEVLTSDKSFSNRFPSVPRQRSYVETQGLFALQNTHSQEPQVAQQDSRQHSRGWQAS